MSKLGGVPAQIMLAVIEPYSALQTLLDIPTTVPTLRFADCWPFDAVVPHPLMVKVVPSKVWLTSGGKQAMPTVLEIGAGETSSRREKSLSWVLEL